MGSSIDRGKGISGYKITERKIMAEGLRIENGWESYLKEVIPKGASQIQVIECKRAFYAGAGTMKSLLTTIGDLPEEYLEKLIFDISAELEAFSIEPT
jgi:hypothetical protein